MKIQFIAPFDGKSVFSYDPETEGYWACHLKPGVSDQDTYIPPFPSNRKLQLAYGRVGIPHRSLDGAQRELCSIHAQYPELSHLVEISKCPCALADSSSFLWVTDQPDTRILELAKRIDWQADGAYKKEWYFKGQYQFA